MIDALEFICKKYGLDKNQYLQPVEIPHTNRETFTHLLAEMGFNKGAEVGVEAGIYAEMLLNANPNLHLTCVDAWTAYKGYRDHVSQDKLDELKRITTERLKPFNATIVKGFSMEIVKTIKDGSLDFVYLDANHEFQHVVNDIAEWQKKVRVGGIVAGHDYIKRKTNGYLMHVPMAVNGYMESYQIRPFFVLGMKAEPNGFRDRARSWFYVKPEPFREKAGSGHKILT